MKDIFGEISLEPKESENISKIRKRERYDNLKDRIDKYKLIWDKEGVIQFKSEYIAILQRKHGFQVEFIIAFEDLTKEGYRLMAIDEGKTGDGGSFTGGLNSYYYFQRIQFVK